MNTKLFSEAMSEVNDKYYEDIAKRVGISEKNVSVRLALIRQKMKQYLIEREVFV